jgi:hypothetical protein
MSYKNITNVEQLLAELCVDHGFSMPLYEIAKFEALVPLGIHAFTDALLTTEGLDPSLEMALRRGIRNRVAKFYAAWENHHAS